MPIQTHHISWGKSLPRQAAAILLDEHSGHVIDFAGTLILTQTQEASRQMRESLVSLASERNQALLSLEVSTPQRIFDEISENEFAASSIQSLLAWQKTLLSLEIESYPNLFPHAQESLSFESAMAMARELQSLKSILAENAHDIHSASQALTIPDYEKERWQQLADCESKYRKLLQQKGLRDIDDCKIRKLNEKAQLRWSRIILVAVCDMPAITQGILINANITLDVIIHAPAVLKNQFNKLGIPEAIWARKPLSTKDKQVQEHVTRDTSSQAASISRICNEYEQAQSNIAIYASSTEQASLIQNKLAQADISSYLPEGISFSRLEFPYLYQAYIQLVIDERYDHLVTFCHCPAILYYFSKALDIDSHHWLIALEQLKKKHLPSSLTTAVELARLPLKKALSEIESWRQRCSSQPSLQRLKELTQIIAPLRLESSSPSDRDRLNGHIEECLNKLEGIEAEVTSFEESESIEMLQFCVKQLCQQTEFPEHKDESIPLQGWLELMWNESPHLLLSNFNQQSIPAVPTPSKYLPDSARQQLGLSNQDDRHSRDAYILETLIQTRSEHGHIDIFIPKVDEKGNPQIPSALLLQRPANELPEKVTSIFGDALDANISHPWKAAWKLKMPEPVIPTSISVTAFESYLDCPFSYYLKYILKIDTHQHEENELDALAFGNHCHSILDQFGKHKTLSRSTNASEIIHFFDATLDYEFSKQYGSKLSLAVEIQKESLRNRLHAVAHLQAEEAKNGWEIVETEKSFQSIEGTAISGFLIRGTIDRIDYHPQKNEYRILDYKTSAKAETPESAHFKKNQAPTTNPSYDQELSITWKKLQLPLYYWALSKIISEPIQCGYFNIPTRASNTCINMWRGDTGAHYHAALACAERVIEMIQNGVFWPPSKKVSKKDLSLLVPQKYEDYIQFPEGKSET